MQGVWSGMLIGMLWTFVAVLIGCLVGVIVPSNGALSTKSFQGIVAGVITTWISIPLGQVIHLLVRTGRLEAGSPQMRGMWFGALFWDLGLVLAFLVVRRSSNHP